jgi:hypothetical protein
MLEMLLNDNPKVDRTGFLMRRGAFSLKIERICSDAARVARAAAKAAPPRRVFFEKADVYDWLSDGLSPAERVGLRTLMEHVD